MEAPNEGCGAAETPPPRPRVPLPPLVGEGVRHVGRGSRSRSRDGLTTGVRPACDGRVRRVRCRVR
ncbi:hypothetical protein Shyhy01_25640 [Streptomyces hygroscopicus subsp. hygroscopicus]|nr:hypothetical protein Shyhy01_25640 [Streptomyces hygroscopicus subsp. hygroscopicus]